MSSKPWVPGSIKQRVNDIIEAIDAVGSHVDGYDLAAFSCDRKTISAVEREILVIAEALAKLMELEETEGIADEEQFSLRCPHVPVHAIRGMGHRLRHAYGLSDVEIVWDVVTSSDLSTLKSALLEVYPQQ